eukprot:3563549-Amphidinium_carterae.1
MAPHRLRQRKIQENKNDVLYENVGAEGPPFGLRAEGGTHGNEMRRTLFIVKDKNSPHVKLSYMVMFCTHTSSWGYEVRHRITLKVVFVRK